MNDLTNSAWRRRAVSETHRANPENRRWETSYTKNVYDRLGRTPVFKPPSSDELQSILDARDLLKDYHDTMHVVYEQRDEARSKVAGLVSTNADLRRNFRLADACGARNSLRISQLVSENSKLKAENADLRRRAGRLQDGRPPHVAPPPSIERQDAAAAFLKFHRDYGYNEARKLLNIFEVESLRDLPESKLRAFAGHMELWDSFLRSKDPK